MSGHSKWATIHRAKGVKDAKRGAAFTKLAQAITMAVKQGGGVGDPNQNFRLRLAIEKARQFNMPKENITRSIERGTGEGDGNALSEVLYEGFAPGGVAVMISAVTDNKLRTAQKIRDVLDKSGGNMGGSGAVAYLFSNVGELVIKTPAGSTKSTEELELELIDLGIDDIEPIEGGFVVYCERERTFELKEQVEKLGYTVDSAELTMKPGGFVEVADPEVKTQIESILERLEELDDIQKVWSNYSYA